MLLPTYRILIDMNPPHTSTTLIRMILLFLLIRIHQNLQIPTINQRYLKQHKIVYDR